MKNNCEIYVQKIRENVKTKFALTEYEFII